MYTVEAWENPKAVITASPARGKVAPVDGRNHPFAPILPCFFQLKTWILTYIHPLASRIDY